MHDPQITETQKHIFFLCLSFPNQAHLPLLKQVQMGANFHRAARSNKATPQHLLSFTLYPNPYFSNSNGEKTVESNQVRQPIGLSNKIGQDWDSEAMGHIIKTAVLNVFLFLPLIQQSQWPSGNGFLSGTFWVDYKDQKERKPTYLTSPFNLSR